MEWDEDQQALMLALGVYRDLIHEPCGGWLPETTAPDAEDAYQVDTPHRCHLCTARAVVAERYRESQHPQALMFPATRK